MGTGNPVFSWLGERFADGVTAGGVEMRKEVIMRRVFLVAVSTVAVLLAAQLGASAQAPERANVMDQGGATVLAPDGATVVRQADGIHASVSIPTPTPGEYTYPAGTEPGHPEVFTLWMFVFNHPENCNGPCDGDDLANVDVGFGAYNVAGHANAGAALNLSGRIGVGEPAGGPPGSIPVPLSNPAGAELHLAVTSHGGLDPSTLPEEFSSPTGSPACGCWWVAVFD